MKLNITKNIDLFVFRVFLLHIVSQTVLRRSCTNHSFALQIPNYLFQGVLLEIIYQFTLDHSHKKRKDSLETWAVYIEHLLGILKFTERPETLKGTSSEGD